MGRPHPCKLVQWFSLQDDMPYNFWTLVAHPTYPTWKTGMIEVLYEYLSHKRELPTYKIVTWKTSNGWHGATNNKQVNCWIMCMLCENRQEHARGCFLSQKKKKEKQWWVSSYWSRSELTLVKFHPWMSCVPNRVSSINWCVCCWGVCAGQGFLRHKASASPRNFVTLKFCNQNLLSYS